MSLSDVVSMPVHRGAARHILVFEPDARGHAEEWLLHIARFVRDARPDLRVSFVVAAGLVPRIAGEVQDPDRVEVLALSDDEVRRCMSPSLTRMAFARWWVMRRYLARTGAGTGFFLCIDMMSLPFGLGLGLGSRRRASGILFRPSVHYASFGNAKPSFGERVREWRKSILYPLMLRNPAIRTVHSLDPYFPLYARDEYAHGYKVETLPDPIAAPSDVQDPPRRAAGGPSDRVSFLLFGELTERKGVLQTLRACARLDPMIAPRITVLLAGRIDPPLEPQVNELLRAARAAQPDLRLEIDNRRLSFAELAAAVDACDIVLAPYQRFVGSSGVLIWAARALKPVITQRYGLLCRLVDDHGLGLTVDTTSPDALAEAMAQAARSGGEVLIDPARARAFLAHREGQSFAARVLNAPVRRQTESVFTDSRACHVGTF
jgi:glycosyltransferase involved in cell wall biosynthesis